MECALELEVGAERRLSGSSQRGPPPPGAGKLTCALTEERGNSFAPAADQLRVAAFFQPHLPLNHHLIISPTSPAAVDTF